MPNALAYIALFCWPLVMMVLFRRLPLPAALVWSILGGYLFLPSRPVIDLPALPPIDKTTVPSLAAMVLCLLHRDRDRGRARRTGGPRLRPRPPLRWILVGCIALLLVGLTMTLQGNRDPVAVGERFINGLEPYDLGSMVLASLVMIVPFLLARHHLAEREGQVAMLKALVWGGIAYSVLILVEVRLSPQVNRWVYGYGLRGEMFAQQMRFGGFRAVVFIEHGLRVALFVLMATLAAATLWRAHRAEMAEPGRARRDRTRRPVNWGLMTAWLVVVLILCKAVGAVAIALLLLPLIVMASPRVQILTAATIAAIVLVFPMVRSADLIPMQTLTGWAAAIDEERGGSLQFRFDNEDILLERARERPLAGWGGWGRNRVYDDWGYDRSVTDGTWIIFMGAYGWPGYLARFGLLTLPLIAMARHRRVDRVAAGLSLVLAANLIDLVPNSGLTPLTWMLAGALSAWRPEPVAAAAPGSASRPPDDPPPDRPDRGPGAVPARRMPVTSPARMRRTAARGAEAGPAPRRGRAAGGGRGGRDQ